MDLTPHSAGQNSTPLPATKRCSKCGEEKRLDAFCDNKRGKHGKRSQCRACVRAYQQAHYQRPEAKAAAKARYQKPEVQAAAKASQQRPEYKAAKKVRRRWRYYRLRQDQFQFALDVQEGRCAICRLPEGAKTKDGNIKALSVDHCHGTLVNRGLLCHGCNVALGIAEKLFKITGDASLCFTLAEQSYLNADTELYQNLRAVLLRGLYEEEEEEQEAA